ncbi:hypothetical protein [Vibrio sp. H11]|uniref:hypothetical protein n=1 Tax=Vibrio sp. H11 TaxID=2565928 RepID=UPI0010A6600D|nr:hypothetical protein [Vibrio sp. H11]
MDSWPETLIPSTMDWHLQAHTKTFTSTFNQSVQTTSFPGSQWLGTMQFQNLTRDEARLIEVFIRSLGGANGRFLLRDLKNGGKPAKGSPVVSMQNQQGGILLTSGWLPGQLVMKAGDYFSVGQELKQSKKDVVSSESGMATLEFYPWLRHSPANGEPIVMDKPVGVFRLKDDAQGKLANRPRFSDVSVEVIEAFYV